MGRFGFDGVCQNRHLCELLRCASGERIILLGGSRARGGGAARAVSAVRIARAFVSRSSRRDDARCGPRRRREPRRRAREAASDGMRKRVRGALVGSIVKSAG